MKRSSSQPIGISRSLPLLIAALSMMGPFSIDTYLPSFREMEHSLHATPLQIQQSLTAFLIPFAFMTLWHGALSDAFGRRRVIISSLIVVALSSIGCAFSPSIEVLWAFRVLQGLSAGVFVIGRAVVRDVYEGPTAQRVMSQVAVLFAIGPAIAPVLGGYLHESFGWRSVFVFIALFSAGIARWAYSALPETLLPAHRQPLQAGHLARSYARTLTHPGFLASSLAGAFNFTAIFLYVAGAPDLLLRHLRVEETEFLWLFGPITAGMMAGSFVSGRVAGRWNTRATLTWSYALMSGATAGNIAFHAMNPAALPWTVIPLFFYAMGMSLSLPTLTLIGLDFFPAHRGLASSCQAFTLTAMNAVTAGVLVPLVSASPLRFALLAGTMMIAGLFCYVMLRSVTKGGGGHQDSLPA